MKGWVKGMLIGSAICLAAGGSICIGAWAMGGRYSYYRTRGLGFVERDRWDLWDELDDDDVIEEEFWDEWHDQEHHDMDHKAVSPYTQSVGAENGIVPGQSAGSSSGPGKSSGSGSTSGPAAGSSGQMPVFEGELMAEGKIIRDLEVVVNGGWVEIIADDTISQVVVSSGNEEYRCLQEVDGDTLEIHIRPGAGLLGKRDPVLLEQKAAEIRIPAGAVFQEADLELNAGQLTAVQLYAGKLEVELNAGELSVTESHVRELKSECTAGVLLYQGQVDYEMDAECVAGTIEYEIDGKREDFNYELECTGGAITIDGQTEEGIRRKTVKEYPGAGKKAELECSGGTISVNFR